MLLLRNGLLTVTLQAAHCNKEITSGSYGIRDYGSDHRTLLGELSFRAL
jgi:hypothetical protein